MQYSNTRLRKAYRWRLSDWLTNHDRSGKIYFGIYGDEELMPRVVERSYVVDSEHTAVSRVRAAAYRRSRTREVPFIISLMPYSLTAKNPEKPLTATCIMEVLKEDKKQESSKMETNEIRVVIKYHCKKGISPKEIYKDMVDTLREDAPSYSTVKNGPEDEHRPGRPVESVTQENIDKIHDLVMLDRRMTVRQIEETLGIPKQWLGSCENTWVSGNFLPVAEVNPDMAVPRRK
ncbi:hypothetical protein LAZ67_14001545 [Cordylochernes scorpioides]|uniref:Mos1 transposase HTH domain-containing protein n=1 Tax=Cordylochernes scorpioides TaxID=51811 RepID=A0ABY6L8T4_9ARAC|nr:hypothetical protein LAZ67_14001545 [Cordylochernes scorpioides]